MKPATDRQLQVLRAIERRLERRGYGPSVRDLASTLKVASTHTVTCHLEALSRKRLVVRDVRVARSIRLTDSGRTAIADTRRAS